MSTASKIALLNGLILALLTILALQGVIGFEMALSYHWHKILHIAGVVLFMGNTTVGPFWFLYAYYSGDLNLLKFAVRLLQLTDLYLTIPGIALTVINGLYLATALGGIKNSDWLFYSTLLLFAMWILSVPLIWLQEKLYHVISKEPENTAKLNRILIWWGILGTLIMIPPVIIFYWMVVKAV
jgi:uncharacterized membrane protein